VAVLGYSNTGKTTFIEVFTALARDAGFSTAVVKYSRHPGDFDRPGSDTRRFGETPARFVAYRGPGAWFVTVPGDPVPSNAVPGRAETDDALANDELAEIPPWLRPLADSIDILVLEGRRLKDSLVCLTAGSASTVNELKYPLDVANVVITASPSISETTGGPRRGETTHAGPLVVATEAEAARKIIETLQMKGETK
jgi:hypothetical protein